MTLSAQEVAAKWAANLSGTERPMSEAQLEKVIADYKALYIDGTWSLGHFEHMLGMVLRTYNSSRVG